MAHRTKSARGTVEGRPQHLTHVDPAGRPGMVDVAGKPPTRRTATAVATVVFPAPVARTLRAAGLRSAKGAIVDTAIIAGTMAAKRTGEMIPFCHPLAIENCSISVRFRTATRLQIRCSVSITHRTGVEMEALTGATVAALTVYDMCKALSHEIVIAEVRLVEKAGGRRRVRAGKVVA
ncbi:MAG: cyclic pyranopterin monophosphate synthase MoaC [Lysobacterales bacterium]